VTTKSPSIIAARAMRIEADFEPDDFCLMWIVGPYHITHKYVPGGTEDVVRKIAAVVDRYWALKHPHSPKFVFETPAMFGPEKDTFVLTDADPTKNPHYLLDLKYALDQLVPDKWPDYRPHLTCEPCFRSMTVVPERYVLRRGETDVRQWPC